MSVSVLILAACLAFQAPADPPKKPTLRERRPTASSEIQLTLQKKKSREASQAVERSRKRAQMVREANAQQAEIERMRPYWDAIEVRNAQFALQQQRLAISAYNAESGRRNAKANEKIANAIYYETGAPITYDSTTGQQGPYPIPRP